MLDLVAEEGVQEATQVEVLLEMGLLDGQVIVLEGLELHLVGRFEHTLHTQPLPHHLHPVHLAHELVQT